MLFHLGSASDGNGEGYGGWLASSLGEEPGCAALERCGNGWITYPPPCLVSSTDCAPELVGAGPV